MNNRENKRVNNRDNNRVDNRMNNRVNKQSIQQNDGHYNTCQSSIEITKKFASVNNVMLLMPASVSHLNHRYVMLEVAQTEMQAYQTQTAVRGHHSHHHD